MNESFAARLRRGALLKGTMLTLPCASAAEVLAGAGFDWLFVDAEHGPFDVGDIAAVLQAVGQRSACIVRVPALDGAAIKRTLDLGAAGIIVPQVNTAAHAAEVVHHARYAPQGSRGVGLARAHDYGRDFSGYLERANTDTAVIVQAEHIEAARNIEAIVAVAGIDAVLVGPYDLSASLGCTGQLDHRDVVAAIDRITEHCQAAGMPLGIFGMNAAAVMPLAGRGYTLLVA
ncbi:MAG TPA: aldolase/citrate lyase family protein, partial [Gammaproteobacteria bacterium]|nr:aldolase/citrate lyase family protein [Gammaproteobacteria bacterium]